MENLSLLLLVVKKSILVVGFVGIVSCGGFCGLFSKISTLNVNDDQRYEKSEWRVGENPKEGNAPSNRPWWDFLF